MAEPQYSPPSTHPGEYDFILNPQKPKRRGLFSSGNSPKQRMLISAVVVGGVLTLFFLFLTILFGSRGNSTALISIAQDQAELIRVSDIGINKAKSSDAKNLAVTTKLSLQTSENLIVDRLKKLHKKPSAKTLAFKKNTKTDQQLADAEVNNTYDSTFIQIIQSSLASYRTEVKKVYDASKSKTERQILASSYDGAGILVNEKLTN